MYPGLFLDLLHVNNGIILCVCACVCVCLSGGGRVFSWIVGVRVHFNYKIFWTYCLVLVLLDLKLSFY
uniref:Uncharacterized protein n=1 Tax=Anguilla anguilla TaxID=7936 RepID=A0A0E9WL80_ANGAN